jgi:hypothetical protein
MSAICQCNLVLLCDHSLTFRSCGLTAIANLKKQTFEVSILMIVAALDLRKKKNSVVHAKTRLPVRSFTFHMRPNYYSRSFKA